MDTATALQNFSLTMNRTFKASKQAVYEAWTTKEALTEWFAPSSDMTTIIHELNLTEGGKYKLEMNEPDGTSHKTHGQYIALNPYDQIVFTWEWEGDEMEVNSLVTIDLVEKDGITEMTLTHEKLGSQESVELHSAGWLGCLTQLENYMK